MTANILAKPWRKPTHPKKILAIRFQALGDTVITLPYLLSIKNQYPHLQLDFLTRKEVAAIPQSLKLFNQVFSIGGGRNARLQFILSLFLLPRLWLNQYDAVIDLQNHRISKIIRKLIFTRAWTEFDRSSSISAGERTRQTIEALWSWEIGLEGKFIFNKAINVDPLLIKNGWKENHQLVVLNPAGYCRSRNWPVQNYIDFARLWIQQRNSRTQFVLLLLPSHQEKADHIHAQLGTSCINLMGKANQVEAFAILQKCSFILTEDSGLMHMAWVQRIPTLALFSSSRKDWSAPQGSWSACLDSSDLECGPCQFEVCKFGDNRCLTRYSPKHVLDRALRLCA